MENKKDESKRDIVNELFGIHDSKVIKKDKKIIEKFCGEEIKIIDVFKDYRGDQITCKRESFPNKRFCYIVKKNKVVFTNSRIIE